MDRWPGIRREGSGKVCIVLDCGKTNPYAGALLVTSKRWSGSKLKGTPLQRLWPPLGNPLHQLPLPPPKDGVRVASVQPTVRSFSRLGLGASPFPDAGTGKEAVTVRPRGSSQGFRRLPLGRSLIPGLQRLKEPRNNEIFRRLTLLPPPVRAT